MIYIIFYFNFYFSNYFIKKKKKIYIYITFKNHVKSNSKTKNIVQNSFKYIIDPNRPAYGINSCAEEISSLCMSNENKNKDKPIKLENINDSLNGIYNNNNNNNNIF